MLTLGWRLAPITLFHILPLLFSALSWRELMSTSCRLNVASAGWIRWIRESINNLLPVASIGGDVVSVRLARLRGIGAAQAAASVVVDTTVGVVTQLVFVSAGVTFLMISLDRRRRVSGGANRVDRHSRLRSSNDCFRMDAASKHAFRFNWAGTSLFASGLAIDFLGGGFSDRRASRGYVPSGSRPPARERFAIGRLGHWGGGDLVGGVLPGSITFRDRRPYPRKLGQRDLRGGVHCAGRPRRARGRLRYVRRAFRIARGYFAVDIVIKARPRIAIWPSRSACVAVDGDARLFASERRCPLTGKRNGGGLIVRRALNR